MAVRSIRITGDPVLHQPARDITVFDDELSQLVDDMVDTMRAAPGVGLAAPQIGVPLRVFVWEWLEDANTHHRGTAINPELWLSPLDIGPLDEDEESEGCLSVPGERFPLRRANRVQLRALDLNGDPFTLEASGWLARILQHEYDHLDGVLYVDRLDDPHRKLAAKVIRRNGWGEDGLNWMPGVDHLED